MTATLELISAISAGNAVDTEAAFNAAMAEKISAKLDDLRIDVSKSMFNKVAEVAAEEPAGTTEEE